MSRTYRNHSWNPSDEYLRETYYHYCESSYYRTKYFSKYRDVDHYIAKIRAELRTDKGACWHKSCRSGMSGFLPSGLPSGWKDDYASSRFWKRLVNKRRRNWDKEIIKYELDNLDEID